MSRINNTKLFLDTLEIKRQASQLDLFKEFLEIFPKDISKEELLEENSKLTLMNFRELINEYYEV